MQDILKLIEERQSSRVPFDAKHPIARKDLIQILEAGSWAPTAHNMQNFEIIVIDDKKLLEKIGNIKSQISEVFLKENYQQLSFSVEEFLRKKVGLLGTMFPVSWRTPKELEKIASNKQSISLSNTIKNSPAVLIVVYDTRKRAPASEGDFLGYYESWLCYGKYVDYGYFSGNWLSDNECIWCRSHRKRDKANS